MQSLDSKRWNLASVLIQHGADVNITVSKQQQKQSLLYLACKEEKWDMISLLVDSKADINACNECGETPLQAAIRAKSLAPVDVIIKMVSPLNYQIIAGGLSVLGQVVRRWDWVGVKECIESIVSSNGYSSTIQDVLNLINVDYDASKTKILLQYLSVNVDADSNATNQMPSTDSNLFIMNDTYPY